MSAPCVASHPGRRKCHNDEAGYVAQRNHPHVPGTHIVCYLARDQGIDPHDGGRYLIIDEAHDGTCIQTTLRDVAYDLLIHPEEFCDSCQELVYSTPDQSLAIS